MATAPQLSPTEQPAAAAFPADGSLADLVQLLGGIPASRIRLSPPLGTATLADAERINEQKQRLVELEHGILVEKTMGWYESVLAAIIVQWLRNFNDQADLGQVLGADGSLRIMPGVVKVPDVSFVSWKRFPDQPLARTPIPELIPDLVVEVLSESNTPAEMEKKLGRYFEAGVLLVWYIDPSSRTARAFSSATEMTEVDRAGQLDGGSVLPGFTLSLTELFEKADRQFTRRGR